MKFKNNCGEQVGTILSMYEEARNDDRILFERYIYHYSDYVKIIEGKNYILLEDMEKIPNIAVLVRYRAIRQNVKKMYLPTDDNIRKKRLQASVQKKHGVKSTFFQKLIKIIN